MTTKISRKGALEAARDGGQAFRDGKDLSDCPYRAGSDLYGEFMAHHWMKGWRTASKHA